MHDFPSKDEYLALLKRANAVDENRMKAVCHYTLDECIAHWREQDAAGRAMMIEYGLPIYESGMALADDD